MRPSRLILRRTIRRLRPHTMVAYEGLVCLDRHIRQLDRIGVPGALVECGVWHGGAAALMASSTARPRDIHLFDSFVGIPEPIVGIDGDRAISEAKSAKHAPGGELKIGWDYAERGGPGSSDAVRRLLTSVGYPVELVHIHEGWFQKTLPQAAAGIGPIAFLHLDADWYESTKIALECLYDNVVENGIVMIDDYGAYDGCRRAVDEHLAAISQKPRLTAVNDEIYFIVKDGPH